MVEKSSKIISWSLYVLMGVSALFGLLFYSGAIDSAALMQWGYVLLIATVVVAVISPVYGFVQNPGNIKKLLISLGVVALIAIISYSFAGNTFSDLRLEKLQVSALTSTYVGMGLLFTYITASIAIIVIVFSSIFKIFK